MAGAWLDGYDGDDDDDEDYNYIPEPEPSPAAASNIIACRHCGSIRLHVRSTRADSIAVHFRCTDCDRGSVYDLPLGYCRVYVRTEM